jgi:hypothetical protein
MAILRELLGRFKLRKIDPATGQLSTRDTTLYSVSYGLEPRLARSN